MKAHQLSLSTSLYHVVSNKGASYKEPHGNDLFLQLPKSSTSFCSFLQIGLPKLRITTQPSPKIRQISHHHWMERITHEIDLGFLTDPKDPAKTPQNPISKIAPKFRCNFQQPLTVTGHTLHVTNSLLQ